MSDILDRYPGLHGQPRAMAMMCGVLHQRGLYGDALALGEAAVAAAPGSLAIVTEVRGILSKGVPEFHRPMMLDDTRNRAYAAAIARLVKPGMKVLEIGCGGGLLAMLAARAGAEVVTCEVNKMTAAAASEIVRRNGLSDRIRIIPKLSTDLTIPEDLPEPADLVIHEIFGSLLFDEGVTDALADARKRLLKPGAPSIPPQAEVRAALIGSDTPPNRRTLQDVEGFDMSGFELLTGKRRWLKGTKQGVHACSAPGSGLRMDYRGDPPFGPREETIGLVSTGGLVEGVAQWIRIGFDDGAAHENDPFADDHPSSWGVPFWQLQEAIDTAPGDVIDVTMRHRGMLMTIDVAKRAG